MTGPEIAIVGIDRPRLPSTMLRPEMPANLLQKNVFVPWAFHFCTDWSINMERENSRMENKTLCTW